MTKALLWNHTKSTLVERITQYQNTFPSIYETQPDQVQQQYSLRGLCGRCVCLGFSRGAGMSEAVILDWSCFRDGPRPSSCEIDTAPFSTDVVVDLEVDFLDSTLPRAFRPRWLRTLVVIDRCDVSKPDLWGLHVRGHSDSHVSLPQGFPNRDKCNPRGTFAYLKEYIWG